LSPRQIHYMGSHALRSHGDRLMRRQQNLVHVVDKTVAINSGAETCDKSRDVFEKRVEPHAHRVMGAAIGKRA